MSKTKKKVNAAASLDSVVAICEEKISGAGEDSYFYKAENDVALISVFDGCGGAGGKEYSAYGGRTGAYMASRAASGAVCSWIETADANAGNADVMCATLKESIDEALKTCKAHCGSGGISRMKGSMAKEFPTTAAIALCKSGAERVDTALFWAGDSRAYLLDCEGLAQLTEDDLDGIDAFENISADGVLTNVISASSEYTLHSRELALRLPCIIFCATDGCFGYIQTPMQFEFVLIDCLLMSNSLNEWEDLLNSHFAEISGDDYSFVAAICGYGSFETLQESFRERAEHLYYGYIEPLERDKGANAGALWNKYKPEYYRYLHI